MIARIYLMAQTIEVGPQQLTNIPKGTVGQDTTIERGLQVFFGLLGAIALLIVTIAGFRYVISQGDPQATAKAKNTILYALIGLAVNIFAFTIVTFVVKGFGQ